MGREEVINSFKQIVEKYEGVAPSALASSFSRDDIIVIKKTASLLGVHISNCPKCKDKFSDAFFTMILKLRNKEVENAAINDALFFVKRGVLIQHSLGVKYWLKPDNVDHNVALLHLSLNPSIKNRFSKMPANVDDLISAFDKDEFIETGTCKATDLLLFGDNKKQISLQDAKALVDSLLLEGKSESDIIEEVQSYDKVGGYTAKERKEEFVKTHIASNQNK